MNISDTIQSLVRSMLHDDELISRDYFGRGLKLIRISLDLYRDDFPDLTKQQVKSLENGDVERSDLRLYFQRILTACEGSDHFDESDKR